MLNVRYWCCVVCGRRLAENVLLADAGHAEASCWGCGMVNVLPIGGESKAEMLLGFPVVQAAEGETDGVTVVLGEDSAEVIARASPKRGRGGEHFAVSHKSRPSEGALGGSDG